MEKIIDKITKLLALASNNPNEHEAMAAALKAQQLIAEHNVNVGDLESSNQNSQEIVISYHKEGKGCKWRYTLANIIAKNFRCKNYSLGRDWIAFYGYKNDVEIALEVFTFLFNVGNRCATRVYNQYRKEGKSTYGVKNQYLRGFLYGIKEAFDKQCTALMVVIPQEVEKAYKEKSKNFTKLNNSLLCNGDTKLYEQGKTDGKHMAESRELKGT